MDPQVAMFKVYLQCVTIGTIPTSALVLDANDPHLCQTDLFTRTAELSGAQLPSTAFN